MESKLININLAPEDESKLVAGLAQLAPVNTQTIQSLDLKNFAKERQRYEKGLIAWVRGNDPTGLRVMKEALKQIANFEPDTRIAGFWLLASIAMETFLSDKKDSARTIPAQLARQLKKREENQLQLSAALVRGLWQRLYELENDDQVEAAIGLLEIGADYPSERLEDVYEWLRKEDLLQGNESPRVEQKIPQIQSQTEQIFRPKNQNLISSPKLNAVEIEPTPTAPPKAQQNIQSPIKNPQKKILKSNPKVESQENLKKSQSIKSRTQAEFQAGKNQRAQSQETKSQVSEGAQSQVSQTKAQVIKEHPFPQKAKSPDSARKILDDVDTVDVIEVSNSNLENHLVDEDFLDQEKIEIQGSSISVEDLLQSVDDESLDKEITKQIKKEEEQIPTLAKTQLIEPELIETESKFSPSLSARLKAAPKQQILKDQNPSDLDLLSKKGPPELKEAIDQNPQKEYPRLVVVRTLLTAIKSNWQRRHLSQNTPNLLVESFAKACANLEREVLTLDNMMLKISCQTLTSAMLSVIQDPKADPDEEVAKIIDTLVLFAKDFPDTKKEIEDKLAEQTIAIQKIKSSAKKSNAGDAQKNASPAPSTPPILTIFDESTTSKEDNEESSTKDSTTKDDLNPRIKKSSIEASLANSKKANTEVDIPSIDLSANSENADNSNKNKDEKTLATKNKNLSVENQKTLTSSDTSSSEDSEKYDDANLNDENVEDLSQKDEKNNKIEDEADTAFDLIVESKINQEDSFNEKIDLSERFMNTSQSVKAKASPPSIDILNVPHLRTPIDDEHIEKVEDSQNSPPVARAIFRTQAPAFKNILSQQLCTNDEKHLISLHYAARGLAEAAKNTNEMEIYEIAHALSLLVLYQPIDDKLIELGKDSLFILIDMLNDIINNNQVLSASDLSQALNLAIADKEIVSPPPLSQIN